MKKVLLWTVVALGAMTVSCSKQVAQNEQKEEKLKRKHQDDDQPQPPFHPDQSREQRGKQHRGRRKQQKPPIHNSINNLGQ